jgi:hypothetical protein
LAPAFSDDKPEVIASPPPGSSLTNVLDDQPCFSSCAQEGSSSWTYPRYWEVQSFQPEALFGSEGYAAMFGRFTYKSIVLSKVVDHAICGVRKSRAKPLHLHGGYVRNGRVVPKRRDLEISKQSQRRAGHDLTGLCSCWGFPDRRLFNIVWSNCITGVRGGDGALAVCGI